MGVDARLADRVLLELANGPRTVRELCAATGVPEAMVREILSHVRPYWTASRTGRVRLTASVADQVRRRLKTPSSPVDAHELAAYVNALRMKRPAPKRDADHVAATSATLVRRVQLLLDMYDLDGRTVVFLGDHDLTSLAFAKACPTAHVYVVDFDEDVLETVAAEARGRQSRVRVRASDLRLSAPRSLLNSADLIFTDPPYANAGMRLFLSRSLELLDLERAIPRVVLAFGYSIRALDRALAFQEIVQDFRMVAECVLPGFNEYRGAEVLGSRSSLYALMPSASTPGTMRDVRVGGRIYTGGAFAATRKDHLSVPVDAIEEAVHQLRDVVAHGPLGVVKEGLLDPLKGSSLVRAMRELVWSEFVDYAMTPDEAGVKGVLVRFLPPAMNIVRWAIWLRCPCAVILTREEASLVVTFTQRTNPVSRLVLSTTDLRLTDMPGIPDWRLLIVVPRSPTGTDNQLLRRVIRHRGKLRNGVREAIVHCYSGVTKREARQLMESQGITNNVLDAFLDELSLNAMTELVISLEKIDAQLIEGKGGFLPDSFNNEL